jgi:DnaJ-class molecular chaperone
VIAVVDANRALAVDVEKDCTTCEGAGIRVIPFIGYEDEGVTTTVDCPACEGRGFVLTDAGRQLVAFMERWVRPCP